MREIFSYIVITLFGLAVGSFLNVCIYRLPRDKSIIKPRSFCPNCKKPIRWFDNIPIISFIALRGKCRFCQVRISIQYPLIETLTAIIFCLNFFFFGFDLSFLVWSVFATSLIVVSFIDLEFRVIPEAITVGGILVGLAINFFYPSLSLVTQKNVLLSSFLGVLIGGGSIYLIGLAGNVLFKKKIKSLELEGSMGFGDVELMAMIGAFLGWKLVLLTFFIAPILGSIGGLVLIIKHKNETIAYGPFLSLAGLISLYGGKDILEFFFYY